MTAWILVALAITALLVALAAELLARTTGALAALTVGFACLSIACGLWDDMWVMAVCDIATLVLAALTTATAVRRKLPPYVTGTDDESEP